MLQFVQDMMFVIFGLVLILVLLIVLIKVHKQAQKVKELENQIKVNEAVETAEILTNTQEKSSNG